MTTPLVIGLDLSLTCTGVAGVGWTDYIRPKNLTGHERLAHLLDQVGTFVRNADLVVIEGPSFGGGVKHRHEDLAGLRVMARHWCWTHGIPYAVVPPSCRALYAAGKGNATKGEVRTSIAERYGIELEGRARYDEADAFALLAMGLHHLGLPLADVPEKNATGLTGCLWPAPGVATPTEGDAPVTDDFLPLIRGICTQLGIETPVVTDAFGRTDIRIDRAGMEKIRDTARATGFPELADGIDRMLTEGTQP